MNEKRRLNMRELSLYYDGLLPEEKQCEIESQLLEEGDENRVLLMFECFDKTLNKDLPEDRIDALLCDNLTSIHERLIREEGGERPQSVSLWDWLLMPRNLLAGLAGLLILFGVVSWYEPMNNTSTMIAIHPTATPPPGQKSADPDDENLSNPVNAVVDEAQKQVILAAVSKTKSVLSTGIGYAKEQSRPLGEVFSSAPQTADLSVAFKALTSPSPQKSLESPEANESLASPARQIAKASTRQLAFGLGASLFSLISVL